MSDSSRALITGIGGQDGALIARLLLGEGYEVKPGGEAGAVVAHYFGAHNPSFIRGEPAFPFPGATPDWRKGIPGMRIGGIRQITVPKVAVMPYREAMASQ